MTLIKNFSIKPGLVSTRWRDDIKTANHPSVNCVISNAVVFYLKIIFG